MTTRRWIIAAISAGLAAAPSAAPFAQPGQRSRTIPAYSAIYAFGDSLSDAGNDYIQSGGGQPVSPPYSKGRFTNGNTWVQDLATDLSLGSLTASLNGGHDYAYGGAYAGNEPDHALGGIDLPSQLQQFEAAVPKPNANALYTVNIGANDVRQVIPAFFSGDAAGLDDLRVAVNDEIAFLKALIKLGAKYFVVVNVGDLGKTPTYQGGLASTATYLTQYYNNYLASELSALAKTDHVSITQVNDFTLVDEAVANPSAYGFQDVIDPVWTGTFSSSSSGTLNAKGAAQNTYLWFDSLHPTSTGHTELANLALSEL